MRKSVFGVIALSLLTAACGTTEQQRAATGGLTGLGVGALVGGPIGAVIGGAAGATGGALMPESASTLALNAAHQGKKAANSVLASAGLASPQNSASAGSSTAPAVAQAENGHSTRAVKEAQRELQREGLYKGHIDGIAGPKTRHALTAFQAREGLQQTAQLDQATLQRLNVASTQTAQSGSNANATQGSGSSTPPAAMNSADVRKRLEAAGYSHVSDVTRQSDTTFTARADRGTSAYRLQIDARSGRIMSQQKVAANEPQDTSSGNDMNGSATNNATSGSGSDMTNGSGNTMTPNSGAGTSSNEAGSTSSGAGTSTNSSTGTSTSNDNSGTNH